MIQVTRLGTTFSGTDEGLERLRSQFAQRHCIQVPKLLEPSLLQAAQDMIEKARFDERVHEKIASNRELCMQEGDCSNLLHFLLNNQQLFEFVQGATACNRIGSFIGRVYRVVPGCGHHDSWHSDVRESRMVGMSINLSTDDYSGGVLQIRERGKEQILYQVANTGFGDVIFFQISSRLEHRITEVEGAAAKTAFAGWFQAQPDFLSLLKKHVTPT